MPLNLMIPPNDKSTIILCTQNHGDVHKRRSRCKLMGLFTTNPRSFLNFCNSMYLKYKYTPNCSSTLYYLNIFTIPHCCLPRQTTVTKVHSEKSGFKTEQTVLGLTIHLPPSIEQPCLKDAGMISTNLRPRGESLQF